MPEEVAMSSWRSLIATTGVLLVAVLGLAAPSEAAFPGQNGKIVITSEQPLWTIQPDGSNPQQLTSGFNAGEAAWSSDGQRVAFTREDLPEDGGDQEVYVMNADGTGLQAVTADPANDWDPAWSPGGDKLVFNSTRAGSHQLYVVNTDGTGVTGIGPGIQARWSPDGTRLAARDLAGGVWRIWTMKPDGTARSAVSLANDTNPDWSPDGRRIVFARYVLRQPCARFCDSVTSYEVWTVNADGTGEQRVTAPPGGTVDVTPVWSPDGTKILFARGSLTGGGGGLYLVNPDGTGVQPISSDSTLVNPDWQPLPVNAASTHVRPKGATPLRVPLVPAFTACAGPNRTHGPPLAFGSCSPPLPDSTRITVGASDAGQGQSKSVGFLRLNPIIGVPGPPDDTDVEIRVSVTNVMRSADLADYTGELDGRLPVSITDKDATVSSTWRDQELGFAVPCAATTDTTLGAACDVTTSADSVVPGLGNEGARAVWALDGLGVRDGGPDGEADTPDNSRFLTQGVYVP